MRISEHWLREWVDPQIDSQTLVEQLSMAGLEVDAVEPAAGVFSGVVIGQVTSTEPHPDADKLTLCKVDIGAAEQLDIVCGAKNVRQGLTVAVAVIGAVLPGNFKIKKAKLRGQVSMGMLCSESELGLAEQSDGIMELPAESPVGACIRKFLNLDEQLIEIDFTPNRGDCLSIRGVAREVAALNNVDWKKMVDIQPVDVSDSKQIAVKISAPEHCPNYLCRQISNIDNQQQVPLWMKEKLRRCNLRSHSLTVDITNYVMMELGQPMHAFDADKISGKIIVRLAKEGEKLVLLDGQEVTLKPGTLLIADDEKPLAIAGVMGGLDSSVTEQTKHIVFESAFFAPEKIAGVARSYGLATDSAYRFERGVAIDLQNQAIERASELLMRFAGGHAGAISKASFDAHHPKDKSISLSAARTNVLLGTDLSQAQISDFLTRLGMSVEAASEDLMTVNVPSFRFDISMDADLIEEVARIFGYNSIPAAPIQAIFQVSKTLETKRDDESLRHQLSDLGYNESINYSFVCPDKQAKVYAPKYTKDLLNPLSKELSQMRYGLWVGLLNALDFNLSRQINTQKLFEIGQCFLPDGETLKQVNRLAAVMVGSDGEHDWAKNKRKYDFYDLKGDLENLLETVDQPIVFMQEAHPALHPGKSAAIYQADRIVGYIGELHPNLKSFFSFSRTPLLFEIDIDVLIEQKLPAYEPVSKFPLIARDLSFVVNEKVHFYDISQQIKDVEHEVPLKNLELFDVYQGDNIEKGKKSLAVGLTLQHPCRTLVDSEVNDYMSAILLRLEEKFDITLRD